MDGATGTSMPLAGIRVLDMTQFEAGPSCTQLLAFFGAEVIKIERPGRGEQGRSASADVSGLDSFYFLVLNANKRSITLDVKQAEGKRLLFELVRSSHVLIQNLAPGTAERLGIDGDTLREVNPSLIYASISGFGRGTRYESFRSFDPVAQAAGGAVSLTGERGGPPMRPGPTFADSGTGLLAAIGILMALFDRERTGKGREVDVALQDGIINFCRVAFGIQAMTGEPTGRMGNGISFPSSPANVYLCSPGGKDDYCYIYTGRGVLGDRNWVKLLGAIGRDDLVGDPRFATHDSRVTHREMIDTLIESWTKERTKFEVMEEIGAAGVPVAPVLDTMDLVNDEGLRARKSIVDVDHPKRGRFAMPGSPLHLSDAQVEVSAAPLLGEANKYVLGDLLGLSEDDITELERTGVI